MANVCLITTLKGEVKNDSLPYLNEVRFFVKASASTPKVFNNSFKIAVSEDVVIKVVKGDACLKLASLNGEESVPVTGYANEVTLRAGDAQLVVANTDAEFVLIGKNAITSLYGLNYDSAQKNVGFVDISQLVYAINLKTLGVGGLQGDSVLSYPNDTNVGIANISLGLAFAYTNLAVDIENLPAGVTRVSLDSTASFGDVSVLIRKSPNATIGLMRTKCTGRFEDICMALKEVGVYNKSIGCSSKMTLKDSYVSDNNYTFSSTDNGNIYIVTQGGVSLGSFNTNNQSWIE